MISALALLEIGGSAATYETLLGRRVVDGKVRPGNVGLSFSDGASGLRSMTFATGDVTRAATLLQRRAVKTAQDGDTLAFEGHGIPLRVTPAPNDTPSPFTAEEAACVSGLDHVVVRTPDPERAIAFYAGRMGLDLRLDRSNPQWGTRLLFFRCGDLVVEIAHALGKGVSDAPDQLWGLSWRVPDIVKAHARLTAAGVEVSTARDGRRPGSRVFTVKNGTEGVPTIFIGGVGRW